MHHWPVTFGLMGFTTVLSIVLMVTLYRFVRREFFGSKAQRRLTTLDEHYGNLSDSSSDEAVEEVRALRRRVLIGTKESDGESTNGGETTGDDESATKKNEDNKPETLGRLLQF